MSSRLRETAECNVALTLLETPACDVIYFRINAVRFARGILPHLLPSLKGRRAKPLHLRSMAANKISFDFARLVRAKFL